jgi:hypothetical protein
MRTQSPDTSPEFERVQIARIRAFSLAKKFRSVRSWTQSITSANLYAAHGSQSSTYDLQEYDRAVQFVTREYGSRLATLFRDKIGQRTSWALQVPDLQEALLPIIDSYDQLDVCYLLTGSLACSVYGLPRTVQDVDILADLHSQQLPLLFEHLAESYLFDQDAVSLAVQQRTSFSLLHPSRLVKIDIFLPSTVFEASMLQHSQTVPLIEGRAPLWMPSPEDVILTRLMWYRQSGNHADDQWNDLLGILKVQAPTLNLAYLSQQAEILKVSDLFVLALIDAGIRDQEQS